MNTPGKGILARETQVFKILQLAYVEWGIDTLYRHA